MKNEGTLDRIIRIIAGLAALAVAYLWLTGTWQIVLYVVGIVLILTGLMGVCLLYKVLHMNTKKKEMPPEPPQM